MCIYRYVLKKWQLLKKFVIGKRGGNLSVFLMGCYDEKNNIWKTVTKVHTGHDDKTLDRLQGELKPNMIQIKKNYDSVPPWLECTRYF